MVIFFEHIGILRCKTFIGVVVIVAVKVLDRKHDDKPWQPPLLPWWHAMTTTLMTMVTCRDNHPYYHGETPWQPPLLPWQRAVKTSHFTHTHTRTFSLVGPIRRFVWTSWRWSVLEDAIHHDKKISTGLALFFVLYLPLVVEVRTTCSSSSQIHGYCEVSS